MEESTSSSSVNSRTRTSDEDLNNEIESGIENGNEIESGNEIENGHESESGYDTESRLEGENERGEIESEVENGHDTASDEGDYYGVAKLSQDFDALLAAMTDRVTHLSDATLASVESKHRYVLKHEMLDADKQIAAMRKVLRLCDELEQEFLKIRQIGEIATDFRKRLTAIEKKL